MSDEFDSLSEISTPITPEIANEIDVVFQKSPTTPITDEVEERAVESMKSSFVIETTPNDSPIRRTLIFSPPRRGRRRLEFEEDDEEEEAEIEDDVPYLIQTPSRNMTIRKRRGAGQRFKFTIYEDTNPEFQSVVTDETLSLRECMKMRLSIYQVLSVLPDDTVTTYNVMSIPKCEPLRLNESIIATFSPSSLENVTPSELKAMKLDGRLPSRNAIGYVAILKEDYMKSRDLTQATIRQTLEEDDTTFVYVMPVDYRAERGFLYLAFDVATTPQLEYATSKTIFTLGIDIKHLCYFINGTEFTHTFTVYIGTGRVPVKVNLQGKIMKGIKRGISKNVDFAAAIRGRTMQGTHILSDEISNVLFLAITKCVVNFPFGWERNISALPRPIMCDICNKSDAKFVCSTCMGAKYCSRKCQTFDWNTKSHNELCGKRLSRRKAREILHHKSAHGRPLTDKQRRYFGWISGGRK